MFKKLGNINKEPSKFSFNLSVDNIDAFKAPEVKPAPKTAPTYSIKWKRGDKRKGETTFVAPQGNRLIFNQTFKFSGTLFKEKAKKGGKTVYGKKLLSITLEEKGERNKITVLAKADVDLSEFVDEERELTNSTNVKLTIDKKTTSTLKLTINSKSLKDLKPGDEGYSTYTGVESENEDEEKSEKSGKDDESEKDEKSEKSESESTSSRSEKTAESASSDARTLEKKRTQDTESDKSNKTESEDEKSETEDDKTDEVSTPVKSTPPPKPTVTATATVAPKVASPASPTNNNHELELENKKLQKQVEDLQHKIQEVEQLKSKTESNNWAVMVKKIQKERDEVKEKMRSLELEMEQIKVESARAQQAQAEAEKVLNENNKKSQAEKQKLEKSIAELKDKTSNSKVNEEQINLVSAQKAELEKKCETLEKKLKDAQSQLNGGDDEADELRERIKVLESRNDDQHEQLEKAQQELESVRSRMESDNKSLKDVENDRIKVRQECMELQAQIARFDETNQLLKKNLEKLKFDFDKRLESIQNEKQSTSESNQELNAELETLRQQLIGLQKQESDAKEETLTLQYKLSQSEAQREESHSTIEQLKREHADQSQRIETLQTRLTQGDSNRDTQLVEKDAQLDALTLQFNAMRDAHEQSTFKFQKTHSTLESTIKEFETKNKDLEMELNQLKSETFAQNESLKQRDQESARSNEQLESLQSELEILKRKCDEAESQHAQMSDQLKQSQINSDKNESNLKREYTSQLESLQQILQNKDIQMDQLKSEQSEESIRVKELESARQGLSWELQVKLKELDSLQKQLLDVKSQSQTTTVALNLAIDDARQLRSEMETIKRDRDHALESEQVMNKKLKTIEENLKSTKKQQIIDINTKEDSIRQLTIELESIKKSNQLASSSLSDQGKQQEILVTQLTRAQSDAENYSQQVDQLTVRVDTLQEQLISKEDLISDLNTQLDQLNQKNQKELLNHGSKVSSLSNQITTLGHELEQKNLEMEQFVSNANQERNLIKKQLEQSTSEFEHERISSNHKITNLSQKVNSLETQSNHLESTLKNADAKNVELNQKLQEKTIQLDQLRISSLEMESTHKNEISNLNQQLKKLESELESLTFQLNQITTERDSLRLKCEQSDSKNESLLSELSTIRSTSNDQVIQFASEKEQLDQVIQRLEQRLSDSRTEITKAYAQSQHTSEQVLLDMETKINSSRDAHEKDLQSLTLLRSEMETLRTKYDQLVLSHQQEAHRAEKYKSQLTNGQSKLESLEQSIEKMSNKHSQELDKEKQTNQQLSDEISKLTFELKSIKSENHSLQSQLDTVHAEKDTLEQSLDRSQKDSKRQLVDVQTALSQLRSDRDRMDGRHKEQVDQLLDEKNKLNTEWSSTKEQLDGLLLIRENDTKTITRLNHQLEQLERDYSSQVDSLQKSVMEKSEEKSKQVQSLQQDHQSELERLNGDHRLQIEQLTSTFESQLSALKKENKQFKSQLEQSRSQMDTASQSIQQQLDQTVQSHADEINSLNERIESFQQELKSVQQEKNGYLESNTALNEEMSDLNQQVETLTRQLALASMPKSPDVQQDNSSAQEQLDELLQQNEQLTKSLNDMKKKSKKNEKETKSLQSELDALNDRYQLLQQTYEETKDRKNSAASPPADSGKVNQLMEQLDSIRQLETQRYLIEHSILFADPTCYVANSSVPEPTPVLYKALLSDDYSTKTKEATFPHHMIRAMEYMIERHADHLPTEAFWINVNTRLLSCLKKSGYSEQVSRALQQGLKDVVLDLMNASSNKRKGAQVQVPSILTGEQAPSMDGDELMQQLTRITMQAYFHVLDHVVKRLDPLIVLSVLDHQDENTRAKSAEGGAHMREMLRVLDSFEKQLAANKMDARLQDFLFRTVALYIDATVFNELLRDVNNTSRYLQIKMGVQIVENWYEQHARQSEFKYSRQSADVCAIAQDVLIKDADMKNAVCPDLSKDQVAYLLANLRDEFSKSRTTNVQAPNTDVRLLFVSPIVKLSDDKDQPLLDFEADGNDKVKSAKISEKYTKRQGLEFLK